MSDMNASAAWAGLGLGVALAGAPGPVQAILLAEGVRGGVGRALRAMAGANLTFAALLLVGALGLSATRPSGAVLHALRLAGGAFLIFMAIDSLRSTGRADAAGPGRRSLPPLARGSLAVILNPGGWIFLGTVAASLFATAEQLSGRQGAVLAALALVAGIASGDLAVVLFSGFGLRRADRRVGRWVQRSLATILAALGVGLLISGVVG